MTYKCKHFQIEELVPPEVLELIGEEVCWRLFDEELLRGIDWLRDEFGPATINNWKWRGGFSQSGLRTKSSKYYSPGSMHSFGQAADLKFKNHTPQEIEERLRDYGKIPHITRVENTRHTPSWLHVDTKHTGMDQLYFFNP